MAGKLTAVVVRSLRQPGKYSDGDGLVLRVRSTGRQWLIRYQRDGKDRSMSLGDADLVSLADARRLHTEARAMLAKGVDPLDAKQQAKAAAKPKLTFAEAAERYIQAHKAAWRGNGEQKWRGSLARHVLPVFGDKAVATITVEDVLKALTPIWQTKTATASAVRGRVELILDYAKGRGWRAAEAGNPAAWRGNLRSLLPAPRKLHQIEHHAALAWREAPALYARLGEDMASRCLKLVILTAVRSVEARGCRWDEIDLAQAVWTIPAKRMKGKQEHRVPLCEPALALLRELAELRTSDLVFFGARQGRPLDDTTLLRSLHRLDRDLTVHGFRSTFRDWCADHGKPGDVAEQCLAHQVGSAVERSYRRSDVLDRRRALMSEWADYLTRPASVVVPLRPARRAPDAA
jgi:integrase